MITAEQLRIYRKFDRNSEKWVWAGCPGKEVISDRDWREIGTLIQELAPVKKGIAIPEYEARIRKKLKETTENALVAEEIYELV